MSDWNAAVWLSHAKGRQLGYSFCKSKRHSWKHPPFSPRSEKLKKGISRGDILEERPFIIETLGYLIKFQNCIIALLCSAKEQIWISDGHELAVFERHLRLWLWSTEEIPLRN